MIEVRVADLATTPAAAIIRPVAADGSAATPLSRRLELAAGAAVAEQCRRPGELPVGSATLTPAGALPAEFLVHVAVHSAEERVSRAGVRRGLVNALRRLAEWAVEDVALPPLGTGAGNLSVEAAAEVMVPVLQEHLRAAAHPARVRLVVATEYERDVFEALLTAGDPPPPSPPAPGPDASVPEPSGP